MANKIFGLLALALLITSCTGKFDMKYDFDTGSRVHDVPAQAKK